ncbi:MAG: peptide deformylase [Bacilli bacterium]|jgi:peptide deformylase|nr:peptide deformylase [Bacilli bacterium]
MNNILKKKYITTNDIIVEPNDILKEKSSNVNLPLSKEDKQLLRLMYNHVANSQDEDYAKKYHIRAAVGIAAIQVGIKKRLIAIKTKSENHSMRLALANPIITYKSEQMCYLNPGEGCLSVEEGKYHGIVPRHFHIKVEAYNLLSNSKVLIEARGFDAIVLQHEIDHLDGILYIDRINKLDPDYKKEDWISI